MSKSSYYQKAIDWAKKRGLSNIRANWVNFDPPSAFRRKKSDQPIVPDITGRKAGGHGKWYVEIALKTENKKRLISKWKLLSTLAAMRGGKLFLLAPHGHKAFAERILNTYELPHTQLVYLK